MELVKTLTPIELQSKGIEALTKELGIAGALSFIQLFDKGSGDWTSERQGLLKDLSIENIASEILNNREK